MLEQIKIKNFRAFNEEVSLRVRPITILIGKNSSGKSTIIKFMLMLQQSLESSGSQFLESEGDRVHLGAFPDLRNVNSTSRSLEFKLQFKISDLPGPVERELYENLRNIKSEINMRKNQSEFKIVLERKKTNSYVRKIAEFTVIAKVGYSQNGQRGSHEVIADLEHRNILHRKAVNLRETKFLKFHTAKEDPSSFFQAMIDDRYLSPLRYDIRSIMHLSAIRQESQRAIIASSPPKEIVGQSGQYALPHLQRIMGMKSEEADFILKHASAIAGIERIKFDSSMKGYLAHCKAVNSDTQAQHYLSDFGFGVSQILPILIQGVIAPKNHMVMVEQPEAQLHPTAQLELGSCFVDLWAKRKVMSLVETHSPNLILRIRRLVAQGELNPGDVSLAYFYTQKGMPAIKNLDINPDGSLEKGLPMEFFGADVIEGMKLRAHK